jgi:tight adherence protein B
MAPVAVGLLLIAALVLFGFTRNGSGAAGSAALGAEGGGGDAPIAEGGHDSRASAQKMQRVLSDALERRMDSGRRQGLSQQLELSGSTLRPGEWLLFTAGAGLGAGLVASILLNPMVGLLIGIFVVFSGHRRLSRRIAKRRADFASQLAETLALIASSLRAGQSLAQTLVGVANDAPSPSAEEFRRVLTETRLGRDMTEALYAMAERMKCDDFEWVVGAVDINRSTGGDLAVILDQVTDTIRQRDRIRGQVRTLTAEGRLSGWVVGMLPPGVFGFVYLTNRDYMAQFFQSAHGILLLVLAGVLLLTGAFWLRKLSKPTF